MCYHLTIIASLIQRDSCTNHLYFSFVPECEIIEDVVCIEEPDILSLPKEESISVIVVKASDIFSASTISTLAEDPLVIDVENEDMSSDEPNVVQASEKSADKQDKQFTCFKCGRRFTHKRSLTRHVNFECGLAPRFKCPYCSYCTKRNRSVHGHVRRIHPDAEVRCIDLRADFSFRTY